MTKAFRAALNGSGKILTCSRNRPSDLRQALLGAGRAIERSLRPRRSPSTSAGQDPRTLGILHPGGACRAEALDHVLRFRPARPGQDHARAHPAREIGFNLRTTSGRCWNAPGILPRSSRTSNPGDVLFIDEIPGLSPIVEEILYPALGTPDRHHDRRGSAAALIKLDVPPFTLVAPPRAPAC